MSTKKTTRTTSTGVDNLIDNAFVPDMTADKQGEDKTDLGLMNNLLSELAAGKAVVDSGYRADPEDGEHKVVIKEYREGKGQNGRDDYLVFTMKDVADGRTWDMLLSVPSAQAVANFVNTISSNNMGVFEGQTMFKSFQKLIMGKTQFFVWTAKRQRDGKVLTYVDMEAYRKYLYATGNREASAELRKQKRDDAAAAETYIKKASDNVRAGKAPWED